MGALVKLDCAVQLPFLITIVSTMLLTTTGIDPRLIRNVGYAFREIQNNVREPLSAVLYCFQKDPRLEAEIVKTLPNVTMITLCGHWSNSKVLADAGERRITYPLVLDLDWLEENSIVFKIVKLFYTYFLVIALMPHKEMETTCPKYRRHVEYVTCVSEVEIRGFDEFPISSTRLSWSQLRGKTLIAGRFTSKLDRHKKPDLSSIAQILTAVGASVAWIEELSVKNVEANEVERSDIILTTPYLSDRTTKRCFIPAPVTHTEVSFYVQEGLIPHSSQSLTRVFAFDTNSTIMGASLAALVLVMEVLLVTLFLLYTRRKLEEPMEGPLTLVLSSLASKGAELDPTSVRSHSRRVLLSAWLLGSVCLVVYAQCVFTSSLAIERPSLGTFTVADLRNAFADETMSPCMDYETAFFLHKLEHFLYDFLFVAKRASSKYYVYTENLTPACLPDVVNGNATYIAPTLSERRRLQLFGRAVIKADEAISNAVVSTCMRKNYPYRFAYDALLRRVFETGWALREGRALGTEQRDSMEDKRAFFPHEFTMILWIAGCSLSIATFLIEWAVGCCASTREGYIGCSTASLKCVCAIHCGRSKKISKCVRSTDIVHNAEQQLSEGILQVE